LLSNPSIDLELEYVFGKHVSTPAFIVCYIRYVMEKIDLVLVGAEGVVESGGIINKVY